YAREIMELHTLGVDGGYTQDDVAELSRVLTGWTVQGRGQFVFNPALHDWGAKTVVGMTIPAAPASTGAAGILEGEQVIDMLVTLGHQGFAWATPDGYPDKVEYWAGNIVPRWSFGTTMSNFASATTISLDTTAYRAGSSAATIDLIDQNLFGGEMPAVTRTGL